MQVRIDMHLCGGKLKSIAFFGDAEACEHAVKKSHRHVDEKVPECHKHLHAKKTEDGCCDDKEVVIEYLDITSISTSSYEILAKQFSLFLKPHFPNPEVVSSVFLKKTKYLNYKPPLIFTDIPVFIQAFLI